MKIKTLLLFFSLLSLRSMAQQESQFTHYFFNPIAFNPATVGSTDAISFIGIFRNQWVGFPGAPKTQSFSAQSPINAINSGVGLKINNEEIGTFKFLAMSGAYAYKFDIGEENTLALGLNIGFLQATFDGSTLKPGTSGDALITNSTAGNFAFDLGLGAFYSTPTYFLGYSITQLPNAKVDFSSDGSQSQYYQTQSHHWLYGGYIFFINEDFQLKPTTLIKFDKIGALPVFEVNGLLTYKEKLWGGISSRFRDAISINAGIKINDKVRLGYSYDINYSALSRENSGSHEFFVGYDINVTKKSKDNIIIRSPRFL